MFVNILLVAGAIAILKLSHISSVNFSEIYIWLKYEYNQLPKHTIYIFAVMTVILIISLAGNLFDPIIQRILLPKFKQLLTDTNIH